jgi:hypothetical protein
MWFAVAVGIGSKLRLLCTSNSNGLHPHCAEEHSLTLCIFLSVLFYPICFLLFPSFFVCFYAAFLPSCVWKWPWPLTSGCNFKIDRII